eukprot:g7255.t1
MVTTPDTYPVWKTAKPVVVTNGDVLRYRYAIYSGGKFVEFETAVTRKVAADFTPDDDSVMEAGDCDMVVADTFGNGDRGASNSPNDETSELAGTVLDDALAEGDMDQESFDITSTSLKRESVMDETLESVKRVFLVNYNLPVKIRQNIEKEWIVEWDRDQLSARSEKSIADKMEAVWVGVVTGVMIESSEAKEAAKYVRTDSLDDGQRRTLVEKLTSMSCHPVFVSEETHDAFNVGFCKSVLWPLMHNAQALTHLQEQMRNHQKMWLGYQKVNQLIAAMVCALYKKGDSIWVHDYHLSLLPDAIRSRLVGLSPTIIFFFHCPFPTSEVWRSLPTRTNLLKGVLAANVVGFHTFDHARHFLTACARFIGLQFHSQKGDLGVEYNGRHVMIVVNHVGVETDMVLRESKSEVVLEKAAALKAKHPGRTLIALHEYLQRLNGVTLALLAYERFLDNYPRHRDSVCFVLRCAEIDERLVDTEKSREEVTALVARLQKKHGEGVVDLLTYSTGINGYQNEFTMHDRLALWQACRILIKASVQEGLDKNPMEFVLTKQPPHEGVVMLSEFTTCCAVLNGAIRINPWDVKSVADTIDSALRMNRSERARRRARDEEYVKRRTASEWTYRVLKDADRAKQRGNITMLGAGANKNMGRIMRRGVRLLDPVMMTKSLQWSYKQHRPCLFIFDYGGTLISRENFDLNFKQEFFGVTRKAPDPITKQFLRLLCSSRNNVVFIVSGASAKVLSRNFGDIRGLGMVAENGMYFTWENDEKQLKMTGMAPNSSEPDVLSVKDDEREEDEDENQVSQPFAPKIFQGTHYNAHKQTEAEISTMGNWKTLARVQDFSEWKSIAIRILHNYSNRVAGSRVRLFDNYVSWDFRLSDPEWAKINANHLHEELREALVDYDVQIQVWKGSVNIIPSGMHKGNAVEYILKRVHSAYGRRPGTVCCFGDDAADESMFEVVQDYASEKMRPNALPSEKIKAAFTCIVGKNASKADFFVNGVDDVKALLEEMCRASGLNPESAKAY